MTDQPPSSPVLEVRPLGMPWETLDPFLFCAYIDDAYPPGEKDSAGPAASLLRGRIVGNDWEGTNGWRMYHGTKVPGFPAHPHRGFETITIVQQGTVDHTDSLGATARYGAGDTQWLTTGKGLSHAEMYPLLSPHTSNPLELFQIWLNLPAKNKLAEPSFSMFWREDLPVRDVIDRSGRHTMLRVIAGSFENQVAPSPPSLSWASEPSSDFAIWTLRLDAHASFRIPAAHHRTNRALYFYRGTNVNVDGRSVPVGSRILLQADVAIELQNLEGVAEILLLQSKPIGEPVVQHGPFVMNSRAEIEEAHRAYARDRFGGWPWPKPDPVHERHRGRFAIQPDGRSEEPRDPAPFVLPLESAADRTRR